MNSLDTQERKLPGVVYAVGATVGGGGIGNTAYHAARGLHRHGMLCRLLCGASRGTELPAALVRRLGLPNRALRKLAVYESRGRLRYLQSVLFDLWLRRNLEPADLLHVWANYGLRSLRRAKQLGMVTVLERASTHPRYQDRLLQEEHARWGLPYRRHDPALRRALVEIDTADYVLIPSEFVRDSFIEEGFPEQRLIQVPFRGVDLTHFRPAERRNAQPFRVLFVGEVGLRKGIPYLLDAWRHLGWRDAELWIVGPVAPGLSPWRQAPGELPGVWCPGYVSDPAPLYRQADIFVLPTLEDGSAKVTFEAMASGLPLVTTPNAGSTARDGVEGFIVPPRDAQALADRISCLRENSGLRVEMGRAARTRAKGYSWERYGDRLAAEYRQRFGGQSRS